MTPTPDWAGRALADILDRAAVTLAEAGERFPLYADPDTGRWVTTGRGSWTGGFWAGLLWLRARHTGAASDRAAAAACTARLAGWVEADTSTRGLILWYATAHADGDAAARALRTRAARAALAAMDPELGLVPWGSAFGGPRLLARVDGVPGMVPLLAAAGPEGAEAAASHLRRHLDLCLGEGGHTVPAREFDAAAGWRACEEPAAGWSRGDAWLLLAVADALHRPAVCAGAAPEWEAVAERLAGPWTRPDSPLVPPADAARPAGPPDTSAAAIAAVALLKLARVPGARAPRYAYRAVAILERLVAEHLIRGRLLDGCYDAGKGVAVRHELVWGDYFLALGLAALTDLIDIRDA
ncbi:MULTISPECIES: sugar ABC transporter permease [unclassified Streptomyces]|uniref:sugar ABC transporter permease n=1 Tax=unclassified Streptomyces TaxID=2593676 RepID=UPI00224E1F1A|nr:MULTISPECIES: sugar ABC transporter permease [unclassified Streptomyces]MCX4524107.1 sugar ABC transporter permease [Streptomyces sp. NBC_01551]MCX4545375.1 sugar ABC transporter permease [Streptomyces sp. NBC_01565]